MDLKYSLILLTIILTGFAQSSLKKSSFFNFPEKDFLIFVSIGAVLYICTFFLQVYLLKFFEVSKLTPILTIASMILIVAFGYWFFGETLSYKQYLGILLGSVSIYLIVS